MSPCRDDLTRTGLRHLCPVRLEGVWVQVRRFALWASTARVGALSLSARVAMVMGPVTIVMGPVTAWSGTWADPAVLLLLSQGEQHDTCPSPTSRQRWRPGCQSGGVSDERWC